MNPAIAICLFFLVLLGPMFGLIALLLGASNTPEARKAANDIVLLLTSGSGDIDTLFLRMVFWPFFLVRAVIRDLWKGATANRSNP